MPETELDISPPAPAPDTAPAAPPVEPTAAPEKPGKKKEKQPKGPVRVNYHNANGSVRACDCSPDDKGTFTLTDPETGDVLVTECEKSDKPAAGFFTAD